MTVLLQWIKWARAMGLRYIGFRLFYEIQMRTGILKSQFPISATFRRWITLAEWRGKTPPFFFDSRESLKSKITPSSGLRESAARIKAGEIQFFQGAWIKMALDEWLLNPSTGYRYSNKKHWTEIPDFDASIGDIKYVWEKSRFSFIQPVLRSDVALDEDSSDWVFCQIESWIAANPINLGPNYRCSQETSLRIFNWIIALYFYKDSVQLTEQRFEKIIFSIYWQIKHVRANIHFSRIAVRNNHALTETLCLYTAGLLFPFFQESSQWKIDGKKWFEEEILYQIYEDGSYLQFSFNYQRVVVQLLTWAFSISERHGDSFGDQVYERAYRTLNLLATCQDRISGELPNYGANDGSLFFSWNDESFRNFSPALDALHYYLTGKNFYANSFEDRAWFGLKGKPKARYQGLIVEDGCYSFTSGGLYIFRREKLLAMVVCASYKDRPSQADNLHLDVWYEGKNVLRDGGSYLYNTDKTIVKYFFGTESHNTVMLGDSDQMQKGSRFIWVNWSKALSAEWKESKGGVIEFIGAIKAYDTIGNIRHNRRVTIDFSKREMIVEDSMEGEAGSLMRQIWHPTADIKFSQPDSNCTIKKSKRYYSNTYGQNEEANQIEFFTSGKKITTVLKYA